MSRPKVLMFIDWYLPGFKAGGPIRSCANLVAHLNPLIDFYIITKDRDYLSESRYPNIRIGEWTELPNHEKVMYIQEDQLNEPFLDEILEANEFSMVYIHGLFSPIFSIRTHRYFRKRNIHTVLAPRGMLREGALSLKSWKKRPFLQLARLFGWYKETTFHATDSRERTDIQKWFGHAVKIIEAPNLPARCTNEVRIKRKKVGALELIFAGRIAEEKNLHYAIDAIRKSNLSGVVMNVYGAVYDPGYFERCIELAGLLENGSQVKFHEPVIPDEIFSLLQSHHALFLPTLGENFGHVILESFMAGRPVIISNQTPWKDLVAQSAGYDIDLHDMDSCIRALESMLNMDDEQYQSMCSAARKKYDDFSSDPDILESAKALFLTQ